MRYIVTLSLILSMTLFATVSKAQMRLMAKAHRMYNSAGSILEDSVRYFHSGAKGTSAGKFKMPEFEVMEDSMHVYENGSGQMQLVARRVSKYTGTNFDTSISYELNNGSWRNDTRTSILYKSGKPDTVYYDSWRTQGGGSWRNTVKMAYTWSSNNIASVTRMARTGFGGSGAFRNSWQTTYQYNGSNVTDSIYKTWDTTNAQFVNVARKTVTYTGGKITEVSTFTWKSGNWADDSKSIYAYDGNSRLMTVKRDIYVSAWEPNRIDTFMYVSTNTLPDTMMRLGFQFGGYVNQGKFAYKYLFDGRLTELLTLSWDGISVWKQTNNQDSIDNWYYAWGVNVEKVESLNNTINIYPSPANNAIHITLEGIEQGKHVQFAIMDMQGRLVKNWAEHSRTETTMSVSELPSGTYILFVEDGTFKGVRKFTVSR